MQIEFGDQRFTNGHCLSFLHFFIHVRVVVMEAGGECELILEQKVKVWGFQLKQGLWKNILSSETIQVPIYSMKQKYTLSLCKLLTRV